MTGCSAVVVSSLAIAATPGSASAAAADPKGELIALVCDNANSYQVTLNGNGVFSPGHDAAGTTILKPTSFGGFHGVVTGAGGDVIDEFVDPPAFKGRSENHVRATTSCTFTIDASIDDPDHGPVTITGEGSLNGFVTPAATR